MNLSKELIVLLEKAMISGEYFNPHIINEVLDAIIIGDPYCDNLITEELSKWANNMWSR